MRETGRRVRWRPLFSASWEWTWGSFSARWTGGSPTIFPTRPVRTTLRARCVGVAYDGDADRIGAVNERGEVLFGDSLLILFAREVLRRKPGATIISEVKASQNLYDDIVRHGGKPVQWPAGRP